MYAFFGTARQFVYHYDDYDNIIEKISYRWDSESSEWVLAYPFSERSVYTYDSIGNLIEEIGYNWYFEWRYNKNGRSVYAYDVNGNLSERIEYVSDYGIQDWKNSRREVSYWSELSTSVSSGLKYHKCIIYPNPTNDLLNIKNECTDSYTIEIISLNGKLITSKKAEGSSHQLDLSSLQSGVYFITIRSKDYVRTEKVIKL